MQIIGNVPFLQLDENGHPAVNITDQTTRAAPSYFLQSVTGGEFDLAADSPKSGIETFEHTFEAAPGHGIVATVPPSEILLLDRVANRSLYGVAKVVATNDITIDRPIDHVYPYAGTLPTLGRRVISNAAVVGSRAAPQIFSIRAGSVPADHIWLGIHMICTSAGDRSLFGNLPALANGIVFRIIDGFQSTQYCFKTNGEIGHFCYPIEFDDRAGGGGEYSVDAYFNLKQLLGVAHRIKNTDVLQWAVQDDLTTSAKIKSLKFSAGAHLTQGDV